MGEDGRAVPFDMLVEPDAGTRLGQDGCERGLADLKRIALQVVGLSPDLALQIGLALLPRNRSPGSLHEGLDLLQSEAAILVGVHCSEDPLVSRLKLLQRDGPVTITVHQSEKHPHHHAGMHALGTHHTSSAHHAATHHTSLPHHAGAHHTSLPHHAGALVARRLLLRLLLVWLLRHRNTGTLLGTRRDSATRQNESRRREHQNVLLHFKSPQTHPRPIQPRTRAVVQPHAVAVLTQGRDH
jgi:hypothetical protein